MPWLTGWSYRKKITISGSTGAGTNYQVLLKVGESAGATGADFHVEGHSALFPSGKNDSGDLRFTASDGSTLLDFWVEKVTGTTPNRVAYCWVEVSADLGTNQDIYCYYGNSAATNVSNGVNTFLDFDDWETDMEGWTEYGTGGAVRSTEQAQFGSYSLKCIDDNTAAPEGAQRTGISIPNVRSIIFWIYFSETNKYTNWTGYKGTNESTDHCLRLYWDTDGYFKYYDGAVHNICPYSTGWHKIEVKCNFDTTKFKVWYDDVYQLEGNLFQAATELVWHVVTSSTAGLRTWYIDGYIVRKALYVTEPAFSSAGAEEMLGAYLRYMRIKVKSYPSAEITLE